MIILMCSFQLHLEGQATEAPPIIQCLPGPGPEMQVPRTIPCLQDLASETLALPITPCPQDLVPEMAAQSLQVHAPAARARTLQDLDPETETRHHLHILLAHVVETTAADIRLQ